MSQFLPISRADMEALVWYYCDFLLVTGDAYIDHPSFGTAIISRVLEDAGFRVAILSQPDFRDEHDFAAMGRPRYAVLINVGNIDSMVGHYTAAKKHSHDVAYTPGGGGGRRLRRSRRDRISIGVEVFFHFAEHAVHVLFEQVAAIRAPVFFVIRLASAVFANLHRTVTLIIF